MPYSNAELRAIYTQLNMGSAGPAIDQAAVDAIATQTRIGQLSDAEALQAVFDLVDDTTGVAALTYQFFTGSLPTEAGFAFLVNSPTNTTDLNDPYFAGFNAENRFINFALNLALGTPANQAAFAATFGGSTTLVQALELAYDTIIGNAAAEAAGIDVDASIDFLTSPAQVAFYRSIAVGRGAIPASDAVRLDLAIKAIAIAELLFAASTSDIGNYASALNEFYLSLVDATPGSPGFGNDLLETFPPAATVVLTANADVVSGNVFNAPRVFSPGGDEQLNSLNDDDVLTGVGANPTLNLTFVNETEGFDDEIAPTLNNIQTINVDFRTDDDATLDLQDATGVQRVNLSGIDDGSDVTIDNIQSIVDGSINDSNAPTSEVQFLFDEDAVEGTADAATLTLNNAEVGEVYFQEGTKAGGEGVETLTLVSTGDENEVGVLYLEEVQKIVITGDEDLTLGTDDIVTTTGADDDLIEATTRAGGLANVAGSLSLIDASALTGDLSINIDDVFDATQDGTSGTDIAVVVKGGSGNDTFYLHDQLGANDSLTGGAGTNKLVMLGGSSLEGKADLIQKLEIRTDDPGTVTVDTSLLANLTDILVRNEGQAFGAAAAEDVVVNLNKLAATVASTGGITVLHGTTGNNGLTDTVVKASLATNTANDTVKYILGEGVNADPRFNVTFSGTDFENVVVVDSDSESNSVDLAEASVTASLTVSGGKAGGFLNFDMTKGGIYGLDMTGKATGDLSVVSPGRVYQAVATAPDTAQAFQTTKIDASGELADFIIRVGSKEGQSITGGSGNDTFVFDASNLRAGDLSTETAHAGLTNSDVVKGGAGNDRIAVDGNHTTAITLQDSEWEGVSQIDEILLVGNTGTSTYQTLVTVPLFVHNYRLDITDDLIDSTDGGSVIKIRNDDGPNTGAQANDLRGNVNNLVLDLTPIDDKGNTIEYNGAEGAGNDVYLLVDDSVMNGKHLIDGGDTTTAATDFSGNGNIIEIQNSATVTIADWNGVSNFDEVRFVNDGLAVGTLNLDLNDTVLDRLADSNHAASITERENWALTTFTAAGITNLNLNFANVSGAFNVGVANASGNTNVTVNANQLTDFTFLFGGTSDRLNVVGSSPGLLVTDAFDGTVQYQMVDALGNPVGAISDITGVEIYDFSGFSGTNTPAVNFNADQQTASDSIIGSSGNDSIVTGSGADTIAGGNGNDTISGSDGNDAITGGDGLDILLGGIGSDIIGGGAGNDGINGGDDNDLVAGGEGNDTVLGGAGDDIVVGGVGQDTLSGGAGAGNDVFSFAAGDSLVTAPDSIGDYGTVAGNIDVLDLPTTQITADTAAADGADFGVIKSHSVTTGVMFFDDVDAFNAATDREVTVADLPDVIGYLQANIADGDTVVFYVDSDGTVGYNAGDDAYVYQAGVAGAEDTLIRLVGQAGVFTAAGIDNTPATPTPGALHIG